MADTTNLKKLLKGVQSIEKQNTQYFIKYKSGEKAVINVLNRHVFKYYMSPNGKFLEYPKPNDPSHKAKINKKKVTDYDTKAFEESILVEKESYFSISTSHIAINIDKENATMQIIDKRTNKETIKEINPVSYGDGKATQVLQQNNDEYYFGGGMQNGRFTHKGETIHVINSNKWDDGGVASPCPFYWSTYGYGVMRNTWQPGIYDFSSIDHIKISHEGNHFDAFYFINSKPRDILNDYYELTGQPILMPEYAFYEAHLNAFNRDLWYEVDKCTQGGILFEDGKYYKSCQPKKVKSCTGILESLNGEKDNYQFSARAMIDRYRRHDMPLGWFVPNDGYGSGYGQTDSLDGDIQNLKDFADYARSFGIEVGLWTESNLHPCDPENPKKGERDLNKEVKTAGVVALKADVAWIGNGYSFGLSAIENAADTFVEVMQRTVRPMVIMVDGWAGTQRCAGIWSGDQRGGQWEYIRFHIPTYIGTGLSGQPNIGSDMDGIYEGNDRKVNIRDYQWKTFTPIQLNMDGWGNMPKTPFSFDKEATDINRAYLKLKSILMPYNYTIAYESIQGLPMNRAMFLGYPNEQSAFTKDSQYQFMWGPDILVAPIYNGVEDEVGNAIRDGVYLPDPNQVWIDFFTGAKYQGGMILNDLKVPLWKLPVFIKDGAIIPLTNPNNSPNEIQRNKRVFLLYPNGDMNLDLYEDDGISTDYLDGKFTLTHISANAPSSNEKGSLFITVNKSKGMHKKIVIEKSTEFQIMATEFGKIKVAYNNEPILLKRAETKQEYQDSEDVYYFDEQFNINPFIVVTDTLLYQKCLLIKIRKVNIANSTIQIKINEIANKGDVFGIDTGIDNAVEAPNTLTVVVDENTSTSITLDWEPVYNVTCYEIERDGVLFSNILRNIATFTDFKSDTEHCFRIRSRSQLGVSDWSPYVIGKTKEDPFKHSVKGVKVTCNFPCQPNEEICNLTDGCCNSMWHTNWGSQGQYDLKKRQNIKINFDLKESFSIKDNYIIYKDINKVEYHPRDNGGNGNFSKIRYKTSENGIDWSNISSVIQWTPDNSVKIIDFNGLTFRFLQVEVLESVGNFGSGKQMLFFKKI